GVDRPCVAIRSGDYVLRGYYTERFSMPTRYALYHVIEDLAETHDLSTEMPHQFEEMKKQLEAIYKSANAERKAQKVITY
ncbi:MAG: hypothetical protein AAGA85_26030, partial [Bacteroidota bacterium]